MKIIVFSQKDTAGINIAKVLIKKYGFKEKTEKFDGNLVYEKDNIKLISGNKEPIFLDYLDESFSPELYVFISKHASKSKIPTLTAHCTGVFSDDISFGGKERSLSISPAFLISESVRELNEINQERKLNYNVSLECTHHGPVLKSPLMFIEVGSWEENWRDLKACTSVADATMKIINLDYNEETAIGFGGPHYCPNFTKRIFKGFNIGHICPKYSLDFLDEDLIKQMINRTIPKPKKAILDWKGMVKEQRNKIISILKKQDLDYEKIK